MAVLDTVFLVITGLLTLRCFLRGFSGEIISLASLSAGVLCAVLFFRPGAVFLRAKMLSDVKLVPEILAFIIIFVVVFIAGKILDKICRDIIKNLELEGLNRFLGLALGIVEGLALSALLVLLLRIQPLFDPSALLAESVFARLALPYIGLVRGGLGGAGV